MSRKKKKKKEVNTNGWMDTYADTITLLLTFFILLYSISSVDSKKLNELSQALKNSLKGETEVGELQNLEDLKVDINEINESTEYEDLVNKLSQIIENNSLAEVIKIREEDDGVVLQLDETILFDSGKANLKEYSKEILDIITTIITNIDNDVLIEGNTDNVPIKSTEYATNWELSTARAVSVVRYFVESKKLDPTRFSVKGYGEFKPLVENDTPENKAINRRVDILIVEQKEKQ